VALAIWLPFRAMLMTAIFLHDTLRLEYGAPLESMRLFWNASVHLLLLLPPVLLAWRLLPRITAQPPEPPLPPAGRKWQAPVAAGLVGAAVVLLTAAVFWDPVGARKEGRVLIEEYPRQPAPTLTHPNWPAVWEPTDKPFDTEWYGKDAGYNYYCIANYCGHIYDVRPHTSRLSDAALEKCDVLVLKVPIRAYSQEEIKSILKFVAGGGGLLLIGEHTNFYGSGANLNAIARHFGFTFRYDCLFGVDSPFEERYEPPLVPHPAIQHMPGVDFAVSCSIDPSLSCYGRAVMRASGLKSCLADYHASNFYPQAVDNAGKVIHHADSRYGAFVQLWSTRYGAGRVLGFTDSTQFSNACTFDPGKAELMLGMVEWLNHNNTYGDPRWPLAAGGLLLLAVGLFFARNWDGAWLVLLAAGLLAWSAGVIGVRAVHRSTMPVPQAKSDAPLKLITVDRTICSAALSKNMFDSGKPDAFGIFERWMLRLKYFTSRRSGPAVFDGDLVVLIYPDKPVPYRFRDQLVEYVANGGKVLVLDSPENTHSTANEVLQPFGLSVERGPPLSGYMSLAKGRPWIPIMSAATVSGGEPFAWLVVQPQPVPGQAQAQAGQPQQELRPVAARLPYGKGWVSVLGFGSRFSDAQMGGSGDTVPDEQLREVFELEFTIVRSLMAL